MPNNNENIAAGEGEESEEDNEEQEQEEDEGDEEETEEEYDDEDEVQELEGKEARDAFYKLMNEFRDDECAEFDNVNFPLTAEWATKEDLLEIANFIRTSRKCEVFRLVGSEESQVTEDIIIELANAMKENTSVETFILEVHPQLAEHSAEAIAEMLKVRQEAGDKPVVDIRVGSGSLGDDGLAKLVEVLPNLTSLEYFAVNDNGLSDVSATLLAEAVFANEKNGGDLIDLDFDENPEITSEGEKKLVRTMLECGIQPNEYTSDTAIQIMEELREKDKLEREAQADHVTKALDNPESRDALTSIEHRMFGSISYLMIEKPSADNNADEQDKESMEEMRAEALNIVKSEVDRISQLTQERTEYYSLSSLRWESLRAIKFNNDGTFPHVQPVGIRNSCDEVRRVLLGEGYEEKALGKYDVDEALKGVLARAHAKALSSYFAERVRSICDRINEVEDIEDLELPKVKLPFDDDILVDDENRVVPSFGPVKQLERSLVKAAEYQQEIEDGSLPGTFPDGHLRAGQSLSGMDYVLDWLRATVAAQDPYLLFIFFLMLKQKPANQFFKLQRLKNKFFNEKYPPNIRTNVLMNLFLLYPPNKQEYTRATSLHTAFGSRFQRSYAGQPLTSVEIQLTLSDFLTIKRLMHDYYNVERSPDPLVLLRNPLFVENDSLKPKAPKVVREKQENSGA